MSELSATIGLDLLRAIRADVADLRIDTVEIKARLGILDRQSASLSRRIDRLCGDVESIKGWLDIVSPRRIVTPVNG